MVGAASVAAAVVVAVSRDWWWRVRLRWVVVTSSIGAAGFALLLALTDGTGVAQLRRLHALGRPVRLLPMARDLDDQADLRAFARSGGTGRLAATAQAVVARLGEPVQRPARRRRSSWCDGADRPRTHHAQRIPKLASAPGCSPRTAARSALAGTDSGSTVPVLSLIHISEPTRPY